MNLKIYKTIFKLLVFFSFIAIGNSAFAQQSGVSINETGNPPHESAILDLQSVNKGFLPPRMATSERDAISNPEIGLQIFNTDEDCNEIFTSSGWNNLCSGSSGGEHYLGQEKDGGIIFYIYIDSNGVERGLIVHTEESTGHWQTSNSLVGANRTWDGVYNTNQMTNSPAKNYVQSLGSGWYLPSIDELSLLWHNRFHVNFALNNGNYTLLSSTNRYWSSNELNSDFAFTFDFGQGKAHYDTAFTCHPNNCGKSGTNTSSYGIRAIRSF